MWRLNNCSMILVSTLLLLHQWLFCLVNGHVWCMAQRRTELITRRWLATTEQTPPPENNDWKPNDSGCKILRFESTATLKIVLGMDLAEDSSKLFV